MFRTLNDFLTSFEYEAGATQQLLDSLTDASLQTEVAEGYRTLGSLAWHVTTSVSEMMSRTGLAKALQICACRS